MTSTTDEHTAREVYSGNVQLPVPQSAATADGSMVVWVSKPLVMATFIKGGMVRNVIGLRPSLPPIESARNSSKVSAWSA